jgi:glycine cleavage system H protein
MDGFTYSDIFATKGIEYLVVITFLVALIPFWLVLNKHSSIARKISNVFGSLSLSVLKIPQGLFYGKNHTWMYMEKSGVARIGLDDLLLHLTGEVNCTFTASPGEMIRKGELIIELNQHGKRLRILSPLSGTISEINSTVIETPQTLNDDPYGKGWIFKIKPSDWVSEVTDSYFASEATAWSAKELEKIKNFLTVSSMSQSPENSMIILQDGGELCDHTLSGLPESIWKDFEKEFLELPLS